MGGAHDFFRGGVKHILRGGQSPDFNGRFHEA
jgi:hypothetical protein